MTSRRTAWAVAASLLMHLAALVWMPGVGNLATSPTVQATAPHPRTLHVLLQAPAPPDQPKPATQAMAWAARSKTPSTARTRSAASLSATAHPTLPPATAELPPHSQATSTVNTETNASAVMPEAAAQPLDLTLPQRHAAHGGRSPSGKWAGWSEKGPQVLGPSVAEVATSNARLSARGETHPGPVTVREQRSTTQTQAEVRTLWGRYCMRKQASSRLTELHDSPFGQGMQSTNCPDG